MYSCKIIAFFSVCLGAPSGGDRYAALADLDIFKTSTTQSVFSGSSNVGSSMSNGQPNPFMSPGTGSSGAAVFQQQQQQAINPFQSSGATSTGSVFSHQQVAAQQPANAFGNQFQQGAFAVQDGFAAQPPAAPQSGFGVQPPAQQSGFGGQSLPQQTGFGAQPPTQQAGFNTQPQSNNWNSSNMNFNTNSASQYSNPPGVGGFSSGGVPNMVSSQQNLSFGGAGVTAMAANQFKMQSNQQPRYSNQINFQTQGFGSQQPHSAFPSAHQQTQQYSLGPQHPFGQQQAFSQQSFNQQQSLAMQHNFTPQQNQNFANAFGQQPQTQTIQKPPFGGVQMPGLSQQPQQPQQQQQFGAWGQQVKITDFSSASSA